MLLGERDTGKVSNKASFLSSTVGILRKKVLQCAEPINFLEKVQSPTPWLVHLPLNYKELTEIFSKGCTVVTDKI